MRLRENIARGTFCLVFQAIKLSMSKCFLPEKLRATEVGIQNSESKKDAGGPRYAEYRIHSDVTVSQRNGFQKRGGNCTVIRLAKRHESRAALHVKS